MTVIQTAIVINFDDSYVHWNGCTSSGTFLIRRSYLRSGSVGVTKAVITTSVALQDEKEEETLNTSWIAPYDDASSSSSRKCRSYLLLFLFQG